VRAECTTSEPQTVRVGATQDAVRQDLEFAILVGNRLVARNGKEAVVTSSRVAE